MAKLHMSSFIICLMLCIGAINAAVTTGYFYDNPIRPFNPPSFSSLRSTAQYPSIPYGQKVETNTRPKLKLPPIPSLPPLTTSIPKQTTKYQSNFGRVIQSSTPSSFNIRTVQQQGQQTGQRFQQQQLQQQTTQPQRPQQQKSQFQQTPQQYYPKAPVPLNTQFANNQQSSFTSNTLTQQRNNIPQTTNRPSTTQFYQSATPAALNIQRQTPKPTSLTPVVPQQVVSTSVVSNPTAPVINTNSNRPQTTARLQATPDIYFVDGRQLKQYKVYEHIDNDIDQEVHNFLPADFFLNTFHSMIGDTHPLDENLQVQNRASSFQQRSQQISQPTPNNIALGSGGLGFVKLPNGNVYLGSGSLGYISSLQHSQDVQDLRSRTSSTGPDPLHFGHGPLSDSFYYGNQKD